MPRFLKQVVAAAAVVLGFSLCGICVALGAGQNHNDAGVTPLKAGLGPLVSKLDGGRQGAPSIRDLIGQTIKNPRLAGLRTPEQ